MPARQEGIPQIGPSINSDLNFSLGVILWLMNLVAIPFQVVVRRNFGERYFSVVSFVLSMSMFATFGFMMDGERIGLHVCFAIVAIVMGVWHQLEIFRRNRRGEVFHSYYDGDSFQWFYRVFGENNSNVARFWEPLFVFLLGFFLSVMFRQSNFVQWTALGSFALFAKANMEFNVWRHRVLDVIDAQIESKNMQAAVEGKKPKETQGFQICGIPKHYSQEQRQGLARAMTGLDPELQDLIAESEGAGSNETKSDLERVEVEPDAVEADVPEPEESPEPEEVLITQCPECSGEMQVRQADIGMEVTCPHCREVIEVVPSDVSKA